MSDYTEFLRQKIKLAIFKGFDVAATLLHSILFPHQRDIVRWAVLGGNRAIFAKFGLGKSLMQCEWLRQIIAHAGGDGLIVCPLGVRQELIRDAAMLGMRLIFIRSAAERVPDEHFYITNYESIRDGKLDPNLFTAVSLDEASVLRSFGSKTYQEFLPLFEGVKFKLVNTATPSPNRYKELIHYAGFLGVMDTGQALTRFFQRDSEKAGNLTLYPHKTEEFWLWVSSWAVFVQYPSDLGHCDDGYVLPDLNVHYSEVPSDYEKAGHERDGQALMFTDPALGLSAAAREKNDSLPARVAAMGEIIDGYLGFPQGVHARVPEDVRAQGADAGGTGGSIAEAKGAVRRRRRASRAGEGAVSGDRREESSTQALSAPEVGVRDHSGGVRPPAEPAGERLCDLPGDAHGRQGGGEAGALPVGGSRSQDRSTARAAVSSLQLRPGSLPGQPDSAEGGDRVPDQVILWCDLNAEQEAIEAALAARGLTFSSVHGSLTTEECERRIDEWRARKTYALIGKPVMLGQGMNLQQCNKAVFVGVTYKFNDLIQAVHRIQRFGQTRECHVHIVYSEAEREVLRTLQTKWKQHEEMVATMTEIIKKYGLNQLAMQETLARTIGIERIEIAGERFKVANNDCVEEAKLQPESSVDLIVTSIPFANHYEYSPSYNDFGHTEDNDHFWRQMDYLTPELLRILKPGRLYCCHVKDRINFGNVTGAGLPTSSPFHAEALFHGIKHGFDYLGMITVVTDVVRENASTYRLSYTEMCKDGSKMGVGSPEYILLFHKPQSDRAKGYADTPIKKAKADYSLARWQVDAHALWRSSGNRMLTAAEMAVLGPDKLARAFTDFSLQNVYDYEFHVKIGEELFERQALPTSFMSLAPGSHHPQVWHDVVRMITLNSDQSRRAVEKHVCPLQFDIVDRLIERYSMPGEMVYDPFCGLGTVPYRAILKGRRGGGSELNPGYFLDQVHYLRAAEQEFSMPSLFDAIETEQVA